MKTLPKTPTRTYAQNIRPRVQAELQAAEQLHSQGKAKQAFRHLERAHVLGQASTVEHVRVHWRMLRWGWQQGSAKEVVGQLTRIIGAATKTALGWVPRGNTGGANISPFRSLPVPADLQKQIDAAKG